MLENGFIIIIVASVIGFFMAWAIGANDVANAIGISVGSGVLSVRTAIITAAIFEALGAMLASGNVTNTIGHGLINVGFFANDPVLLVIGMIASLLASAAWLLLASYKGWPVSTTHTIIGAVIGFGLVSVGLHNIMWDNIFNIMISWLITPFISGILSYSLFSFVQKSIFEHEKPAKQAKKTVPYYVFFAASVILFVIFYQGLAPLGVVIKKQTAYILTISGAFLCSAVSYFILRDISLRNAQKSLKESYALVEKVFGVLAVFTACAMAFAHGSNDIGNAIAPIVAINAIVISGGVDIVGLVIPHWIVALGALGVICGLIMYGYKVIATVGKNITTLTPSRGFVAQLVTASIVVISSGIGVPVSTTHILVGAVLGVGLAKGLDAINLRVVRGIFLSWFITFPAGMLLSIIFYKVITLFL
jgi:inorganic phosphate transporter, PiT family